MICITGAGGTVGSEVLRQLQAAGAPFRAAHFSKQKADAARASGIEAVSIDYHRPETLRAAFEGCDRLYLLGPTVPEQIELEINAVDAAKAAGVRHIVKQSVYGAAEEAFVLAKIHRQAEKAIESSGLRWTFLRLNSFMQNVVTFMGATIRAEDTFYSASGDGRIAHIDVRDIAAVAVKALTEPGHENKAHTLTGAEAFNNDALAKTVSKALGRSISRVNLAPADYKSAMLAEGMPEAIVDALIDLERYFREGHAANITGDIKRLIGREPIRFEQYAGEHARMLQPEHERVGAER